MTIRTANPDDARFLPELERSSGEIFRTLPDLAWIADDAVMPEAAHLPFIAGGTVWVADDGTGPHGFLTAEVCPDALHIWQVAVENGRQGQGIGRGLVQTAVADARRRSLAAVTLTTFRDVPWNAPFYAKLGFLCLEKADMGSRLAAILRKEADAGLPPERRCAMRLDLA